MSDDQYYDNMKSCVALFNDNIINTRSQYYVPLLQLSYGFIEHLFGSFTLNKVLSRLQGILSTFPFCHSFPIVMFLLNSS